MEALYLKYRPRTFDEVEGQEFITRTLRNAVATGRIAHAYLFCGPRGTGKTSTARILAKAVNCLADTSQRPCNECAMCRAINDERMLDLIEIDAASNNGIDDVRELRDKVDFRPGEARYKVYIVDEAHMMSGPAFNALLKTLEEPPPYVIFVLATTDPNKLPATIVSRCQRFDFRRATLPELVERLSYIADQEGLTIEPDAIQLVARQATGSFRDAASLLDQLMSFGGAGDGAAITLAQVQGLLGAASPETVHSIVAAMARNDVAGGIAAVDKAVDEGADPRQLSRDLIEYLRGVLLFQVGGGAALTLTQEAQEEMTALGREMPGDQLVRGIRLFTQVTSEMRNSASPTLPLEMALVQTILEPEQPARPAMTLQPSAATAPAPRPEKLTRPASAPTRGVKTSPAAPDEPPAHLTQTRAEPTEPDPASSASPAPEPVEPGALTIEAVRQQWPNVIARLRKFSKSSIDAFLRDAEPISIEGSMITVGFYYPFHKEKVEQDKNAKPQVEKALSDIFKTRCQVRFIVSPKKQKRKAAENDPLVRAALDMGGEITDIS